MVISSQRIPFKMLLTTYKGSIMDDEINDNTTEMVLDPETIAILKSIFNSPGNDERDPAREEVLSTTAGVKFMITTKEEKDLRELGYSQAQIEKMKPQEATHLLQTGIKAMQG